MAYTTNTLISESYYSAGVVSRDLATVDGDQITEGLQWLNDILTEKQIDKSMVPYETTYTLNAVIGQEAYPIPNLVHIDTLVFFKNNVRFAMTYNKRNRYFGSNRVENIDSLPFTWYFERGFGGGTLYIYFEPDQAYPMEIHGVFALSEVALNQDLSLTLDQFYRTYLRYALADRICAEYQLDTPSGVMRQLSKYESFIDKKSRVLDLRLNKVSTLNKRGTYNWAFVNLGNGFVGGY